ncbi:MAG TPA: HAD-IA family hydrolase [Burkholderiales bacterium]|jgi:putative hydrolase of the HAD superfamily|nr:HAD-IA family hydrolase [Burkholderiales bacterium]HEX2651979.1 HAD-IA family hydrolase [Burkholderiales bacterium]
MFDFDGVLTTDTTGSFTTTRYLSQRTGIELSRVQSAFRRFNRDLTLGRTTHAAVWEEICTELGLAISLDLLEEAFESTPLNERMLAIASGLRSRYSVGIITDNKKDRIDTLKRLHDLPRLFDPIVVSSEVGIGKDNPEIFLGALRVLRVKPEECIFIDNSQANLIAPEAIGMKTIYFDDEKQDFKAFLADLQSHGAIAGNA